MNYSDFLSAIALGLSVQSIAEKIATGRRQYFSAGVFLMFLIVVVVQLHVLTGRLALPTLQNRATAYPAELVDIEVAFANQLPKIIDKFSGTGQNDKIDFGIIGTDLRILYTLDRLGYNFPPVTNTLPWDYRRLRPDADAETLKKARNELESIALWTDSTVEKWLTNSFEWILVERKPSRHNFDWLIWKRDHPLIVYALSNCFVRAGDIYVPSATPEILASLYYRTRRGQDCINTN
jgi:hypothetical protein